MTTSTEITAVIVALLRKRDAMASICPSDVARALGQDDASWRDLMSPVREAAKALARSGALRITQRGEELDPDAPMRGPLRLRRGPAFPGG